MNIINKEDLINGASYVGICRNARIAKWLADEDKFLYIRYKFGFRLDRIEHFEDVKDEGYDGFIPVMKIEDLDYKEVNKLKKELGY